MSRIPVQLSPGVNYTEIDLTTIVPSTSPIIGAIAGVFQWGPAEKITTITNEDELVRIFGKPLRDEDGIDFHCAANYLQYTRNLKVVRSVGIGERNANSAGNTGIQLVNEDVFQAQTGLPLNFYARYPGVLGNSLKVVMIDGAGEVNLTTGSTSSVGTNTIKFTTVMGGTLEENDKLIYQTSNFSQTFLVDSAAGNTVTLKTYIASTIGNSASIKFRSKYADLFQLSAETSTQASNKGGSNDELNVVVVDEDGLFSGTIGGILETFQNVSKAYDAKDNDGVPNYVTSVLNENSDYIWAGDLESLWGPSSAVQNLNTTFGDITSSFGDVRKFSLSGGTASANTTDRIYTTGYSKFADRDNVDISLLISGRSNATTVKLLTDIVNDRRDCVLFVSPLLTDILNKTQTQRPPQWPLCIERSNAQLRVLSTNLFLAIQGIMERNCEPTFSIEWSSVKRRRAVMLG